MFSLYYFIPGLLFGIWFHAYLVKTYGGTPGKLLLKIKITKVDGTDVGYKEALLRYSVLLLLTAIMSIAHIMTTLNMTDQVYFSMEWMERAEYINANMPSWYSPVVLLMNAWVWSEYIVMLSNKKRRAIHDYMAGTVVIHKGAENMLPNNGG